MTKLKPALFEPGVNLKLAIEQRNRSIHGHDPVDAEITFSTAADDLSAFQAALSKLLAVRG